MKMVRRIAGSVRLFMVGMWPLFAMVAIAILSHFIVITNRSMAPYFSAFYITVGGLTVVWNIDSKLRLFLGKGIMTSYLEWLQRINPFRKPQTLELKAPPSSSSPGTARVTKIQDKFESIDERMDYLQSKFDELKNETREDFKNVENKISCLKLSLEDNKAVLNKKIKEVDMTLRKALVGSFKGEIFGIILVTYGTWIPVIYQAK